MSNRIVQLVLWRDVLLALTEQGEILWARVPEDAPITSNPELLAALRRTL